MTNHGQSLAGLALPALLACPPRERPGRPYPNVIRAIDVADRDGGVEVAIRGHARRPATRSSSCRIRRGWWSTSREPTSPASASPCRSARGGVRLVSTAQYKDEKSTVGRVVIALDGRRATRSPRRGETVRVKVLPASASATPASPQRLPQGAAPAVGRARTGPSVARERRAVRRDPHPVAAPPTTSSPAGSTRPRSSTPPAPSPA